MLKLDHVWLRLILRTQDLLVYVAHFLTVLNGWDLLLLDLLFGSIVGLLL